MKGTNRNWASSKGKDAGDEERWIVRRRMAVKDYYQVLGVKKDASEEEIKKAYRYKSVCYILQTFLKYWTNIIRKLNLNKRSRRSLSYTMIIQWVAWYYMCYFLTGLWPNNTIRTKTRMTVLKKSLRKLERRKWFQYYNPQKFFEKNRQSESFNKRPFFGMWILDLIAKGHSRQTKAKQKLCYFMWCLSSCLQVYSH